MRVCLTLSGTHVPVQTKDCVFAFLKHLERQCDSISACDIFVEGTAADRADAGGCIVRLALHVFGEQVNVTGTNSMASDAPLQSALRSTYRKAVRALHLVARRHNACSCHNSQTA